MKHIMYLAPLKYTDLFMFSETVDFANTLSKVPNTLESEF